MFTLLTLVVVISFINAAAFTAFNINPAIFPVEEEVVSLTREELMDKEVVTSEEYTVITAVDVEDTWVICATLAGFESTPAIEFVTRPATEEEVAQKEFYAQDKTAFTGFYRHYILSTVNPTLMVIKRGDNYVSFTIGKPVMKEEPNSLNTVVAYRPRPKTTIQKTVVKPMHQVAKVMTHKMGLDVKYFANHQVIVWTTPSVKGMLFQLVAKEESGVEIHFADPSIKMEWQEAGRDITKALPLTGVRSSKEILGVFNHFKEVMVGLGYQEVATSCRCEKRRRIYVAAAKRLGFHAYSKGESVLFSTIHN